MATISSVQVYVDSSWVTSANILLSPGDSQYYQGRVVLSDGTTNDEVVWVVITGSDLVSITEYGSGTVSITAGNAEGVAVVSCIAINDGNKYVDLAITIGSSGSGELTVQHVEVYDNKNTEWTSGTDSADIGIDDNIYLEGRVLLSDGSYESDVTWSLVSGSSVRIAASSGAIVIAEAQSEGSSLLKCVSNRDTSKYNYVIITVSSGVTGPTIVGIQVQYDGYWYTDNISGTLDAGESTTLDARAYLDDGTYSYDVSWYSNDSAGIVTISTNGSSATITAGSVSGTEVIRCESNDDPNYYILFTVTVEAGSSSPTIASFQVQYDGYWYIDDFSGTLEAGESTTLNSRILMSDGTYEYDVQWSSANSAGVVSISSNGPSATITAGNTAGTEVIKCESISDPSYYILFTVTVEVTVVAPTITTIQILYNDKWYPGNISITLKQGESTTIQARAIMSDGSYQYGFSWGTPSPSGIISRTVSGYTATIVALETEGTASFVIRSTLETTYYRTITVIVEALVEESSGGYSIFIYNNGWKEYSARIYNSTTKAWEEYEPDIYPFSISIGIEPTYVVATASGATYGFELNSDGYYESTNAGVNSSASVSVVTVTVKSSGYTMYIDCINYAEPNYDFGIISNIGSTLGTTYTADTSTTAVKQSFKESSYHTDSVQSISYGELEVGTHTFYVKYRKDSSQHHNKDSFQFTVRFEKA